MTARYGLPPADAPLLPPRPLALTKRAAFILEALTAAGAEGVTAIDFPGVRVSDAILKLRRSGVDIQTVYEQHGGEFAGHHGRYILRSKVVRLVDDGIQLSRPTSAVGAQAGGA